MENAYEPLTSLFTDIADAIRYKTKGTDPIVATDLPDAIRNISTYTITKLDGITLNDSEHSIDGSNMYNSGAVYDIGVPAKSNCLISGGWHDGSTRAIIIANNLIYKLIRESTSIIKDDSDWGVRSISRSGTTITIPQYLLSSGKNIYLTIIDYD